MTILIAIGIVMLFLPNQGAAGVDSYKLNPNWTAYGISTGSPAVYSRIVSGSMIALQAAKWIVTVRLPARISATLQLNPHKGEYSY